MIPFIVPDYLKKINSFLGKKVGVPLLFSLFLTLLTFLAICILWLVLIEKEEIVIHYNKAERTKTRTLHIFGYKTGTVYYFSHCGVSVPKEKRIYFQDERAAKDAGRRLAKQCH